ncbi:hypothetical protein [Campylobacter curvus]|uniref:hypothetical protein n=1 Tax=Campylobacter curvus TaxID=200 RepID=UPI0014700042|nr:hypothetical protein [Campylobacter curvus]
MHNLDNSENRFWDNKAETYNEVLNDTFECYIQQKYFYFMEKLFMYCKKDDPVILKTDGWDLLYTPIRNPYKMLIKKSSKIIITDISKPIVYNIQNKYKSIVAKICNIRDLGKLFSGKVDLLIDLSTIDHIPQDQIEYIINSYHNCLSEDGYALIIFWKRSWHYKLLNILFSIYKRRFFNEIGNEIEANKNGQYYFDEKIVIEQILKCGFKIEYKKRFGVIIHFLGKIRRASAFYMWIDKILSFFSGAMCAIIVKKI